MIEFVQNNWFWILVVAVFIGMHSLGFGCCGRGHRFRRKNGGADMESDARNKSCQ